MIEAIEIFEERLAVNTSGQMMLKIIYLVSPDEIDAFRNETLGRQHWQNRDFVCTDVSHGIPPEMLGDKVKVAAIYEC